MANGDIIRFSGYTREDCRRWLDQQKRIRMPWHTETDPHDTINAILDLMADEMATRKVDVDIAASEQFWASLQTRTSAVALSRLIGYLLRGVVPSTTYELAELTGLPPILPATVIPALSQWGTEGDDESDPVVFEAQEDLLAAASTLVVYWDGTGGALYFGHATLPVDAVDVSAAAYAVASGFILEFWDAITQAWVLVPYAAGVVDGTANLSQAGTISFDATKVFTETTRWGVTTVNTIDAYWLRFRRVAGAGTVTTPAAAANATATWYASFEVLQGETVTEALGTTTTDASQEFALSQAPIEGSVSRIAIDTDETWEQVDSFYLAGPTDKVFLVREDSDALWYLVFGDGTNGAIPPDGAAVEIEYRVNASTNGNVGAGTVTINRSSVARIASVTNHAEATGWLAAEGAVSDEFETESAALARTRELAPATQRANQRAVTLEDYETLAVRWQADDGRQPIARAYAMQDGAGPRSVEVLVVGAEGAAISDDDRADLLEHFIGERRGTQRVGGVGIAGVDTSVTAYTPQAVNVATTIRVLARYASAAQAAAEAALEAILSPLALDADGVYWRWWPSTTYGIEVLQAAVVAAVPGFVKFDSFTPAGITLGARELPEPGTISVTIVAV